MIKYGGINNFEKMKNINYKILAIFLLGFGMTSCIENTYEDPANKGADIVKILDESEKAIFFSPFLDIKEVDLFDLRRDPSSNAYLNSSSTVTMVLDTNLVNQYNADNGTKFDKLPDSLFTFKEDATITKSGNTFTFNFGAKDFAKNLTIKLNGSKWNLSKKYAIGFKVTDAGTAKLLADKAQIVVTISVKNKYDGKYEVTGTMVDVVNGGLTHINDALAAGGDPNWVMELRTVSANQCIIYDPLVWNNFFIPITSGGTGVSGYGSFAPIFTFDLNTDQIINCVNYYGQPAGNTRSGRLDPSGINQYYAATKTVRIKYNMTQSSLVPAAPHIRTTWDETWKYVGSR